MARRRGADPGRAVPREDGRPELARGYRETAYRLWRKISPLAHVTPEEIETYGGQPNKQAADMLTAFDPGRMIWNGYTGAAGWIFRQALEGSGGRAAGGQPDRAPRRSGRAQGRVDRFRHFPGSAAEVPCAALPARPCRCSAGGAGLHPHHSPAALTKGG